MEDEKDILRRMSSGDSDAFRLVFLKYAPREEYPRGAGRVAEYLHQTVDAAP